MDSVSNSSIAHASMPVTGFTDLGPENHLSVLGQISRQDKPTLRSIASTNRQMLSLATPFLMEAYIDYAESKLKTMVTSAEKVKTILLIHHKLLEKADGLPISGSAGLWERLRGLMLKEASHLASADQLFKGLQATFSAPLLPDISIERVIAMQRSAAIYTEISKNLTRAIEKHREELGRVIN